MNDIRRRRIKTAWLWLRAILNALACLAILAAAIGAVYWINATEPVAEKVNSTRKSAALVETIQVNRGSFSPRITVLGTVQAAQRIDLRPRVSGQVVEMKENFIPGGMVKEGDLLLRIDPADFENAVSIRQSELEQTKASMEIEQARQRLAEKELKLLGDSIGNTNRSLILREPQIASMKAEVSAAQAAVARAKLDLDRTQIFAPFDAQVLTRSVNLGSQVSPGINLGQLVGLDEYWIEATVPVRSLRWIQFPEVNPTSGMENPQEQNTTSSADDDESAPESNDSNEASPELSTGKPEKRDGSMVILRNNDAWGPDVTRQARITKLIGTLDQQTRLARVLITVDDPLALKSDAPTLIIDTLLETEIEGRPIDNVVQLNRSYVRDGDTVWIMKDDKLEIRETEIVFRDAEHAYIRSGLEDGDEVVTTTLATVAAGIGLRKINDDKARPSAAEATDETEVTSE